MRVYVHGNCQARAIGGLLEAHYPAWEVSSYEVFTQKILDEIERYHEVVATADIIISQPVHDGYRGRDDLSLNWIRSHSKPNAEIIIFPSLFFTGQLVGWNSVEVSGFGMPYHDLLTLHCAALGMGAERVAGIILDPELYPESLIADEIRISIEEMRRRESGDGIDVHLSPFLARYGELTPLFHIINHPGRPVLAYITNSILSRLGFAATVPFTGPECIPIPHVPLHASVRRFLEARGGKPEWPYEDDERFHLPTDKFTPGEYCGRVIAHLRSFPREELMKALGEPHVRPFMRRLAAAIPTIPEIDMWA